jgi:hypothetical protein
MRRTASRGTGNGADFVTNERLIRTLLRFGS